LHFSKMQYILLKLHVYDVNVYTWASSTMNTSSVGTLINTAGK
jgi:hypothetical protein